VTPTQAGGIPGKLILSIGGSNAGPTGWKAMALGGVDNWVGYFKNLFLTSGLQGLDWDLEQIVDPSNPNSTVVWDFIGQVSQQLKAAGNTITFTIFQSTNPGFPPAWFLQKYADACTYVVVMLYNGGVYVDASGGSWCGFAATTYGALPSALQSKFIYALYPLGGTQSCCAPCVQQAVDYIRAGKGVGIAFWCYGGWLGACGTEGSKMIVAAWVDILNNGGGSGMGDFLAAFPLCSGATAKDGCGRSASPQTQYYSCSGSSCNVDPSCTATKPGCYDTSTCNNECSVQTQRFKCTGIACSPDNNGAYPNQAACQTSCGQEPPQMYGCNSCGQCAASPTGTYSTSNCDGQCGAKPTLPCSSLGMPVPSGGSCSDPSAQFTCNGDSRCCCLGSVPSPSATNPTACSAPAAARYYRQRYRF
jgi:hypothetical protein